MIRDLISVELQAVVMKQIRNKLFVFGFLAALAAAAWPLFQGSSAAKAPSPRATPNAEYGKLPLYFIENRGQTDSRIDYYIKGKDKSVYFTAEGVTYALIGRQERDSSGAQWTPSSTNPEERKRAEVKVDFLNARTVHPRGVNPAEAKYNFFVGNEEDWKTQTPTYHGVVYEEVWSGIDLAYAGTQNQIKYEFTVRPGADPSQIRLAYSGADVSIDSQGRLQVATAVETFHDGAPYVYQDIAGKRVEVASSWIEVGRRDDGAAVYGFELGSYDKSAPLVLDPVTFVYAGFIGGTGSEVANGVAVDYLGRAIVVGWVSADGFVTVADAAHEFGNTNATDAFIARVKADGTGLEFVTIIGGAGHEIANDVAIDGNGGAYGIYVVGSTESSHGTFPETVGPSLSNTGNTDAFVGKLSTNGDSLTYLGFVGGQHLDLGSGIAIGVQWVTDVPHYYAYIAGTTEDGNQLPYTVGPDLTYGVNADAFVAKIKEDGSGFEYLGFIGGSELEWGGDVAVDQAGQAFVVGVTASTDLPTVDVVSDTFGGGSFDGYLARVAADGTSYDITYLGGSSADFASGVAVDSNNDIYVTGGTDGSGFPTMGSLDSSPNGSFDAFVLKVDAGGSLVYSGFIGGDGFDGAEDVADGSDGAAYVVGTTRSTESTFPVGGGPDDSLNGSYDAFVARVAPDGDSLDYAGYIGGDGNDVGLGVAVGSDHSVYVVGEAAQGASPAFPTLVGPDLSYNGGGNDAFIVKISPHGAPPPPPLNQDPVADAGDDAQYVADAPGGSAMVMLDGSDSFDPDGTIVDWEWTNSFGTAHGESTDVVLGVGVHVITLTVEDDDGATDTDTVTITVIDPEVPFPADVTWHPTSLYFELKKDGGTDSAKITLNVEGGPVACVLLPGTGWMTLSPENPRIYEDEEAVFTVTVDPSWLFVGKKTADIYIRCGARILGKIPVTLVVLKGDKPDNFEHGVVNAASLIPWNDPGHAMAPGSIVSIFGLGLTADGGEEWATEIPLPTELHGSTVEFGGIPSPLFYVSGTQINAALPWALAGAETLVSVTDEFGTSVPMLVPLSPYSPAIFTKNMTGAGQGIVTFNGTATLADAANPAEEGDLLVIYSNGLGQVSPAVADGANSCEPDSSCMPDFSNVLLRHTVMTPRVWIGGVEVASADILYSGMAPEFVSLNVIIVRMPGGVAASGAAPVVIDMGGYKSRSDVTIAVE